MRIIIIAIFVALTCIPCLSGREEQRTLPPKGARPVGRVSTELGNECYEFKNDDLREALGSIARADGNIAIAVHPNVNDKLSVKLTKISPLDAIKKICQLKQLTCKQYQGIWLIKVKEKGG
jgi:hypothetical protein